MFHIFVDCKHVTNCRNTLNSLRDQTHPQGSTHAADSVEARRRIRTQRPSYKDKASRVSPDALAISRMPRARAMSPRMASNNAGSCAVRMSQTRGDCRIAVESRRRVELKAGI